MKNIILLSDTHGMLDERFIPYLKNCDEIWHAGDIGENEVFETLKKIAPLRAVFGNIDGYPLRHELPEWLSWQIESIPVLMTHIGGRPPKFSKDVLEKIKMNKPKIFICGHSHILLVQYLKEIDCLHLNPGAAGKQGWHKVQTLLKFQIDGPEIKNMEVVELNRNTSI
jgi:putative phosphoesterase